MLYESNNESFDDNDDDWRSNYEMSYNSRTPVLYDDPLAYQPTRALARLKVRQTQVNLALHLLHQQLLQLQFKQHKIFGHQSIQSIIQMRV
jgi:hypothetical protein